MLTLIPRRAVKKEYESHWSRAVQWIEGYHQKGITAPADIFKDYNPLIIRSIFKNSKIWDYYRGKDSHNPDDMLAVREGKYELSTLTDFYEKITQELVNFVTAHQEHITDIVELGSGTGRNIFVLSHELATRGITGVRYHALEYTEAGRKASALLNSKHTGQTVEIQPFDYYNPDFSFLKNGGGVLFYSVHSIEQIPLVPEKLIEAMIERNGLCYAMHFEPIGWQYDSNCQKLRKRHDSWIGQIENIISGVNARFLRRLGGLIHVNLAPGVRGIPLKSIKIGSADNVSMNAAKWSAAQQYNKNFVNLLHTFQDKKKIKIMDERINMLSVNAFNPATIVAWKSIKNS